jgi:glycosyltransferase involved in cell wall biosynthesis
MIAKSSSRIELTIIMPCLNEAETLKVCIDKAARFLAQSGISGEILVGDNGSTDGSQDIARRAGAVVVDVPVRGYGAALFAACHAANGRFIIMGDSDDSYDFSNLMGFVTSLREGFDLVMGNRFKGGIKPGAMPWKNRYIGNPILSGIGKFLFRCPASDFHCGLRGFSKQAFLALDLRTTGMEFASEMVIKATLSDLKIAEVPTTLSPDGRSRPPHLRPWRDGWRHLRFMLLFSPNWLFLYPGILLMLAGVIFGGILLRGPLTFSGIQFDSDTLIYCSFGILMGFQAVVFSFLSRVYATHEGLYPRSSNFSSLLGVVNLERGLVVGVLAFLTGFLITLRAVFNWKQHHFGTMELSSLVRWVIPAATAMSIGVEIILFSFFFSTLELGIRHFAVETQRTELKRAS